MDRETITLKNFSMIGQTVDILNDEGKIVVDFSQLSETEKESCMNFIEGDIYAFDGTKAKLAEDTYSFSFEKPELIDHSSEMVCEYLILSIEEKYDVADVIIRGDSIIYDLSHMKSDEMRAAFDFIGGTIYGMSGKIEKIGENVFKGVAVKKKMDKGSNQDV